MHLQAGSLNLTSGSLLSQQAATVPMTVNVTGQLTNTGGIIQSGGALNLKAGEIALATADNGKAAALLAENNLTISTAKLTAASNNLLQSHSGDLILRGQGSAFDASGGVFRAAKAITAEAGRVAFENSNLGAGDALTLTATTGDLDFIGTANAAEINMTAAKDNAEIAGELTASGNISADIGGQFTVSNAVKLIAGHDLAISAGDLSLGDLAMLSSQTGDVRLNIQGGSRIGAETIIASTKTLDLTGSDLVLGRKAGLQGDAVTLKLAQITRLDEAAQIIGENSFDLTTDSVELGSGALLAQRANSTQMAVNVAGKLINNSGVIQSGGALNLRAGEIILSTTVPDRRAVILSENDLSLTTGKVTAGTNDLLQSKNGAFNLNSPNSLIDITGGTWRAAKIFNIKAGAVTFKGSDIAATGAVTLDAHAGNLDFNGRISADTVALKSVGNASVTGRVSASQTITGDIKGQFSLASAANADAATRIIGGKDVKISAANSRLGNYAQLASQTGNITLINRGATDLGTGATIVSTKALKLSGTALTLGQNAGLQGDAVSLNLTQAAQLRNAAQIAGESSLNLKAGSLDRERPLNPL